MSNLHYKKCLRGLKNWRFRTLLVKKGTDHVRNGFAKEQYSCTQSSLCNSYLAQCQLKRRQSSYFTFALKKKSIWRYSRPKTVLVLLHKFVGDFVFWPLVPGYMSFLTHSPKAWNLLSTHEWHANQPHAYASVNVHHLGNRQVYKRCRSWGQFLDRINSELFRTTA